MTPETHNLCRLCAAKQTRLPPVAPSLVSGHSSEDSTEETLQGNLSFRSSSEGDYEEEAQLDPDWCADWTLMGVAPLRTHPQGRVPRANPPFWTPDKAWERFLLTDDSISWTGTLLGRPDTAIMHPALKLLHMECQEAQDLLSPPRPLTPPPEQTRLLESSRATVFPATSTRSLSPAEQSRSAVMANEPSSASFAMGLFDKPSGVPETPQTTSLDPSQHLLTLNTQVTELKKALMDSRSVCSNLDAALERAYQKERKLQASSNNLYYSRARAHKKLRSLRQGENQLKAEISDLKNDYASIAQFVTTVQGTRRPPEQAFTRHGQPVDRSTLDKLHLLESLAHWKEKSKSTQTLLHKTLGMLNEAEQESTDRAWANASLRREADKLHRTVQQQATYIDVQWENFRQQNREIESQAKQIATLQAEIKARQLESAENEELSSLRNEAQSSAIINLTVQHQKYIEQQEANHRRCHDASHADRTTLLLQHTESQASLNDELVECKTQLAAAHILDEHLNDLINAKETENAKLHSDWIEYDKANTARLQNASLSILQTEHRQILRAARVEAQQRITAGNDKWERDFNHMMKTQSDIKNHLTLCVNEARKERTDANEKAARLRHSLLKAKQESDKQKDKNSLLITKIVALERQATENDAEIAKQKNKNALLITRVVGLERKVTVTDATCLRLRQGWNALASEISELRQRLRESCAPPDKPQGDDDEEKDKDEGQGEGQSHKRKRYQTRAQTRSAELSQDNRHLTPTEQNLTTAHPDVPNNASQLANPRDSRLLLLTEPLAANPSVFPSNRQRPLPSTVKQEARASKDFWSNTVLHHPIDPFSPHQSLTATTLPGIYRQAKKPRYTQPTAVGSASRPSSLTEVIFNNACHSQESLASNILHKLQHSSSPDAPKPLDWTEAASLCSAFAITLDAAGADSTRKKDDAWVKLYWSPFVQKNNMNPFLSHVPSTEHEKEIQGLTLALYWMFIASKMKPRSKGNPAAKPDSISQVVASCKRVHARRNFKFDKEAGYWAAKALQGSKRIYLKAHGQDSLQPKRKQPFPGDIPARIRNAIKTPGTKLGSRTVDDSAFWQRLLTLIHVMEEAGFRKGEVSAATLSSRDLDGWFLMRSHLGWYIAACGGDVTNPTPQQISMLQPGDYAWILPCLMKNDQFGHRYGALKVYLKFIPGTENAASSLATMVARHQIPDAQRSSTPLFCSAVIQTPHHQSCTPFSEGMLDTLLKHILSAIGLAPAEAGKLSWHSFRITLACKLLSTDQEDAFIQRVCRWESIESARKYGRIEPTKYMHIVQQATAVELTHADIPSLVARIPQVDEHVRWGHAFAEIDELANALDNL